MAPLTPPPPLPPNHSIPAPVMLSTSGEAHVPAHSDDFDYYHGVGTGGQVGLDGRGGDGGGGAAVIVSRVKGVPLPTRTPFFFTGEQSCSLSFIEK